MTDAATARLALGDAICWAEGDLPAAQEGISPYLILCGGGSFANLPNRPGYLGFPDWPGLRGSWGISHAAGRWQFEPATWLGQAKKLGLGDFRDPAQQDRAGQDLAISAYHAATGRVLVDDLLGLRLDLVGNALHSTWTSVSGATFADRYQRSVAKRLAAVDLKVNTAPAVDPVALIEAAQTALKAAGLYDDAIDGDPGPLTRQAIVAWRAAHA